MGIFVSSYVYFDKKTQTYKNKDMEKTKRESQWMGGGGGGQWGGERSENEFSHTSEEI